MAAVEPNTSDARPATARPRFARVAIVLTAIGLVGVIVAFCLWLIGGRTERGIAIDAGGLGFVALCFGNAASGIGRSVRRSSGRNG
jgi:hypothetical protein